MLNFVVALDSSLRSLINFANVIFLFNDFAHFQQNSYTVIYEQIV